MLKTLVTAWLLVLVATMTASASQLRHSESISRHLEVAEYMATAAATSSSQCVIENGFDYVGEDLTNTPGASAGVCCGQCTALGGCAAFTWTPFNNGTCWLKRGRGKVVVNANAKSSLVIRGQRLSCEIQYNVDIIGNDIGTAKSASAGGCCDLCRAKLGCRAYSWADGTCYLKSGRGQSVVKIGVQSADVYPATTFESSQFCAQEAGVDYVGNDVGSRPSATAGGCCSICQGFPGCGAYTWSNYNGGTCWLKSAKGDTVRKAGVTSAVAVQVPDIFVVFERDTDFVGYDIGNYRTLAPEVCAHKCYNFVNGCRAVTWTDFNGGTCWFKTQKSTTQAKAGALSYAFA